MKDLRPVQPTFCKYLRAKNPYGMLEGGEQPWLLYDDPNTISWCIKATGGVGPDNDLVTPKQCVAGRSCFAPPSKD